MLRDTVAPCLIHGGAACALHSMPAGRLRLPSGLRISVVRCIFPRRHDRSSDLLLRPGCLGVLTRPRRHRRNVHDQIIRLTVARDSHPSFILLLFPRSPLIRLIIQPSILRDHIAGIVEALRKLPLLFVCIQLGSDILLPDQKIHNQKEQDNTACNQRIDHICECMASVLVHLQVTLEPGNGILRILQCILVHLDVARIFRLRDRLRLRLSLRLRLRRALGFLLRDGCRRVHIRISGSRHVQGIGRHGTARRRDRDGDRSGPIGKRRSINAVDGRVRVGQNRIQLKLGGSCRDDHIISQMII